MPVNAPQEVIMNRLFKPEIIAVLALDWAALDDITTGHQPHFVIEYLMLLISIPVILHLLRRTRPKKVCPRV
jgi:hypothetical protein